MREMKFQENSLVHLKEEGKGHISRMQTTRQFSVYFIFRVFDQVGSKRRSNNGEVVHERKARFHFSAAADIVTW